MSSVLERPGDQGELLVPTPVKRFGYLLAAMANGGLLWVSHQLLDWGWPAFLTEDFELVLGIVTASLVAGIVMNLVLVVRHQGRFKALADLVTAGFALAVALRMLEVFPFDFTGYANDWTSLVRLALFVGIAATGIALVANVIQLATGPTTNE